MSRTVVTTPDDEALFGGILPELGNSHESVVVTHVESPVRFYCRRTLESEKFSTLQRNIVQSVDSQLGETFPDLSDGANLKFILVFSTIRNKWCRGRVLSYHLNVNNRPLFAKVSSFVLVCSI